MSNRDLSTSSATCGSALGTGAAIFVSNYNCSSDAYISNDILKSVFKNNTVSRSGEAIVFLNFTLGTNTSKCIDFLQSTDNLVSSRQNFASPISELRTSFKRISMYSSEKVSIGIRVFDVFGNIVLLDNSGVVSIQISSSGGSLLQFGPAALTKAILSDPTSLSHYFVFANSQTAPSIFIPSNVTVQYQVASAKQNVISNITLCKFGQILFKDSLKFWSRYDCPGGKYVNLSSRLSAPRSISCGICLARSA